MLTMHSISPFRSCVVSNPLLRNALGTTMRSSKFPDFQAKSVSSNIAHIMRRGCVLLQLADEMESKDNPQK